MRSDEAQGPRVLVVDDDPDIRALITLVLGRAGWTVHLAGSADQALRVACSEALDLAVLDAMLGRGDGPEALVTALRALPGCRGLPMVFLTARVSPADLEVYEALGVPVLAKPFEVRSLVARLRAHLRC